METPDVLVIGAGVIGCSLARELAREGASVVVVDRGRAGCGASSAAAGLLTPGLSALPPEGPFAGLCGESAALYESWVAELHEEGAGDVGFRRDGLIEVFTDAAQPAGVRAGLDARPGRRAEWLSGDELRRREPAVSVEAAGAVFYPDDAQVNAARLAGQVARAAELAGARIREGEPVLGFGHKGDRVRVHTTAETYDPGVVVLAAGAWSGALAGSLGVDLPTRPVKGQMVLADCRVSPVRTPLFVGDALFVPRPDGGLALGVTVEEAGFDEAVTLGGVRDVLRWTSAVAPAVAALPLGRAWAGLRPATPDGWPLMGPVPALRNLWVSAGHFRKGVLLAPLCARLVARSILAGRADEALAPFDPARFLGCGAPAGY